MNKFSNFKSMSARIGSNMMYVQGSGGNASIKDNGTLLIKASGMCLSDALKKNIFVNVDLEKIRRQILRNYSDPLQGAWDSSCGLRPSIETSLHALMTHPVVFHIHCVETLSWAVRDNIDCELERRLSGISWMRIPYRKPGYDLTCEILSKLNESTVDVLIPSNHGLVVGGQTPEIVERLIKDVSRRLSNSVRKQKITPNVIELKKQSSDSDYRPTNYIQAHSIALSADAVRIASSGSLYPDHVVFLNPRVFVARNLHDFKEVCVGDGFHVAHPVVVIPDIGVLVSKNISYAAEQMLIALSLVVERIPGNSTVNYLSFNDERDLMEWEAEKYRKNII
jgi:rhamnose utilization protein RhaD (predicted bifunctional aldolase and dehydrogenase)